MSDKPKLTLSVVSQDKKLLEMTVDSVSLPTSEGEITVLPGHIPLFTLLTTGEVIYKHDKDESSLVVTRGFADITPDNQLLVMVDTAVHARDLSEEKAHEAVKKAQETLAHMTAAPPNEKELQMAEASLRLALLQLRVAQRTKRTTL
ncbi:MAG TPA: ATP synthase F1 subunit epsilon [Vitreimonas sp.]|nr:ATP synthase F1 subunit epsilon [Vitreimonas sp.]